MLDLSRRDGAGEPAVVMLDHAMLGSSLFAYETDEAEGPVVWPNVIAFLADLEQGPMRYLEANWRFYDSGDGIQYFIDNITTPPN